MVMTMRNIKGKPKGSNVKTFVLGITAFLLLILLAQPVAANVGVAFQQCSNNNHQALGTCDWINSILQDHNSVDFEGMSTPQRVVLTDIAPVTGNTHSLGFHMEASKGVTRMPTTTPLRGTRHSSQRMPSNQLPLLW